MSKVAEESLYELSLRRFDELLAEGRLHFAPSSPELVTHDGFTVEFRLVPAYEEKPNQNMPGQERRGDPFLPPDPSMVVAHIGPSHTLEFNLYCAFRPQFVLHTDDFELQTDNLHRADVDAAWEALHRLHVPHIVLYNCGADAGASQRHKHLQLFPAPAAEEFVPFPAVEELSATRPVCSSRCPVKNWCVALSPDADSASVYQQYHLVLDTMHADLAVNSVPTTSAYNVLFTKDWLVVIPRRAKGKDGINTNGAGMMGMIWVLDEQERDGWFELGVQGHLRYMGIPQDVDQLLPIQQSR